MAQREPPKSALSKVNEDRLEHNPFDVLRCLAIATSPVPIEQLSPAALAYIGDAVYELYIRTHYLFPPKRISAYHDQVVARVRAESQAHQLRSLEPYLDEEERGILRRGRNAATRCPQRLSLEIYQQATSLETLIGYLYLTNPQRLDQLLRRLDLDPH